LQRIGRLVQIPVLDHIIVTRHSFTSFRENKWFKRSLALAHRIKPNLAHHQH
jgi:hypothetical protein